MKNFNCLQKFSIRIVLIILAVAMMFSCNSFAYSDTSEEHWAYIYINMLSETHVINGFPDGTFQPEKQVTHGEFIKMIATITTKDYEYKQPQADEHWAMQYVDLLSNSALNYNVRSSDYNYDKLNTIITRGEMCNILYRAFICMRLNNPDVSVDKTMKYVSTFSDVNDVPEELKLGINNSVQFGLINGFPDGTFKSSEGLTRAQAAKVIYLCYYSGYNIY